MPLPSLDLGSSLRRLFTLCTLTASTAAFGAPAPAPTAIDSLVRAETRVLWRAGSPDSALAAATREGKPAFLDFYADWCAPCRWMDRAVYSDPLLGEISANLAMIRVDVETAAGRALVQRYGVLQYPTLVFVQADGNEKLRWPGPLSLRDTRLNLAQTAFPSAGRAKVETKLKERPKDLAAQADGLRWYAWRGEVETARAITAKLEKLHVKAAPGDLASVRMALAQAEEIADRRDRALAAYRSAVAADPKGDTAWRAWLGVSVALERTGDLDGALGAAREARALHDGEPFLDARIARLELKAPAPATPPGVDDGTATR